MKKKLIILLICVLIFLSTNKIIQTVQIMANTALLAKANKIAKPYFEKLILFAENKGYEVIITGCYYSYQKSLTLNRENSKNPIYNYHLFGLAIDLNLVQKGSRKQLKKASPASDWNESGLPAYAKSLGMRWGGDFSTYYDPIHFDLGSIYSMDFLKNKIVQNQGSDPNTWVPYQLNLG